MVQKTKQDKKNLISPQGTSKFAWLFEPNKKFNKLGTYEVTLVLKGKEAKEFKKTLDAELAASLAKAEVENPKKKNIVLAKPPYTDMEDGTTEFKFKKSAGGIDDDGNKWVSKIAVMDSGLKAVPKVAIYEGSKIVVSFQANPYYIAKDNEAGITLRPMAVQIIELAEGKGGSGFGFDKVDGYKAPEESASNSNDKDDDIPFEEEEAEDIKPKNKKRAAASKDFL